jgi:geranylgeranyl diphosphate synthase type II
LHGIPLALNAGDTLSLLSLKPLIDNVPKIGSRLALKILEETQQMAWESAEGQAMELGWRHDNSNDVSDADYLTMVLKKTCWLGMIYPTRVGALIGTRGTVNLEPFIRFGFFLGSAFQIQDDLLNFVADRRYGKELDGDILEGKRTLMLIHAYRNAPHKHRRRVASILAHTREERSLSDVHWIRKLMDDHGSVEYARAIAHGLAVADRHEFEGIFGSRPESRDKEFIRGLVTWVFERC